MIKRARHRDPQPERMVLLSIVLHLAIVFAFNHAGVFKPLLHEAAPYYVDIISLPAVDPAPASPEPLPASPLVTPAAPVSEPLPPAKPVMALPAKASVPAAPSPAAAPAPDDRGQEAREFAQKMSRLEHNAEAKRQAEVIAALQKKAAEKKGAGGAAATGSDKGSDYGAYIQSRLKDVFATTMVYNSKVYSSKAPEAAVHIYIDSKGKLIRYVMERPSADKLFNDSVIRTIEKAKVHFPPPPAGTAYDKLYVFSPQEVTK
jgi:colicin import membrane protein